MTDDYTTILYDRVDEQLNHERPGKAVEMAVGSFLVAQPEGVESIDVAPETLVAEAWAACADIVAQRADDQERHGDILETLDRGGLL